MTFSRNRNYSHEMGEIQTNYSKKGDTAQYKVWDGVEWMPCCTLNIANHYSQVLISKEGR